MSPRQMLLQHRLAGAFRLGRAALLGATALQALPAAAQPAPIARPTGGVVAAGNASIGVAGNTTAITQSSQRAAIDWQSFNVGSNQRVTFNQPSSSAVTLNTVTGPDPSQIAGHIDANGQIIIANRSGVVFDQGAEVNAQSLVVSAAGISRQSFMAGKLVLDQAPQPGVRVVNEGTITVKQAGLAALVAPEVANSGVITAKFGHVVLAGAEAATLDLYGDGLVSVDVTRAVHTVRTAGGQTATALVTNTGAIVADGGTVQLTAAAADGIVTNLVDAGGTIRANTVNRRTGTIAINGTGGSILIEGTVAAEGKSAGSTGGAIEINSDRTVTLAGSARVSASGRAGGGVIAVGTTLARAIGGPSVTPAMTARQTRILRGARVTADARTKGNGGRITVLSTERTDFAGTISARGGATSGNGGAVEISSGQGLGLTGTADVCAPHGSCGEILLDPANLTIVAAGTSDALLQGGDPNLAFTDGGTLTDATVSASVLEKLAGNIHLQATDDITVAANLILVAGPVSVPSLELEAGGNITVNPGITVSAPSAITFIAGSTLAPGGGNPAAGIFLSAGSSVSASNSSVSFTSGTGGMSLGGNINGFSVQLNSTGAVTQPGGMITTSSLFGQSSTLTLGQPNRIAEFGTYTATSGGLTLTEAPGVTLDLLTPIGAVASGQTVSIVADTVTFDLDSGPSLAAPGGTVALAPVTAGRPVELSSTLNAGALSLLTTSLPLISAGTLRLGSAAAGQITLGVAGDTINFGTGGKAVANTLDLRSGAGVVEPAAALVVDAVSGNAASATLSAAGNVIGTLGSFSTTGGFALTNGGGLTVAGPVTDGTSVNLNVTGDLAIGGGISAPTVGLIATGAITEPGGAVTASSLSGSAASITLTGPNAVGTITNFAAASFAIPGPFAFNDTQSVVVTGTVSGDLSISTSGDLTINTGLIQSPGTVALTVGGAINEVSGGFISAGVLTGSAGSGTLEQRNAVSTLGPFATGTLFNFVNFGNLAVSGPVTGAIVVITNNGPLTIGDNITAPAVQLTALPTFTTVLDPTTGTVTQTGGTVAASANIVLSATGTISQTGGAMVTSVLDASSGGSTTLTSTGNAVANLGEVTSGGDFALATNGDLTLIGTLTASNVALAAAGTISQFPGFIATGMLSGTSGGSANFVSAANTVAALGGFAAGGDFTLTDGAPVTIAGTVAAAAGRTVTITDDAPTFGKASLLEAPSGTIALLPLSAGNPIALGGGSAIGGTPPVIAHELIIGTTNAGPITIGGAFNLTQVDVLELLSGGAIAESGTGSIAVPTLTGQGASATLNAANAIGTLGIFGTGGGFALTNAAGLTVAGPVNDGASINLSVTGNLAIAGSMSAPVVGLTATGAITEPGGVITANSLSGLAASVDLTGPNSIAAITNFTAASGATPGAFAFNDIQSVVVSGTVTGDLSISTARNLTINTGLIQSPGTVALTVGGTITEVSGGFIEADVLTGSAASGTLDQPNFVMALGPFATGTGFVLVNSEPLTVAGPVNDGVRAAITSNGPLTVAGNITAPTVLLTALPLLETPDPVSGFITQTAGTIAGSTQVGLSATGIISQTGGLIIAGLLTGNSGGTTTLTSPTNAVAQLGDFASRGDFALATSDNLALTGTLTAPDATLTAAGAISQPSGLIVTGTLTGAGGSASFASAGNTVAALGSFAAAGDFLLADAASVTIAGTVTAGTGRTLTIADNAPAFGAAGLLDAPAGTIALAPLTAGTPIALGGGGGIGGNPPVIAHELVVGSVSAGPITIAGAFNLTSVDELHLISGGAIAEGGAGAIAVPVLTGQGASATLTAGNAIGTLASFTTTGGFALADTIGLTLQGTLSAGSASIAAPGITLAGNSLLLGSGGASFTVLPGASGLGTFGQTGTTTVVRLGGATTVSIALPVAGGTIAFANLVAPGAGLVLTTGAGTAIGQINTGSLQVIGSTGASNLFGTVAGVSGTPAAAISHIQPTIDPHYLLNDCVIESASCGLGQLPQFPNPKLFSWQDQNGMPQLSAVAVAAMLTLPPVQVVRQPRDPDIELPNISNLDY